MVGPFNPEIYGPGSEAADLTRRTAVGLVLGAPLLAACAGVQQSFSQFRQVRRPRRPGRRNSRSSPATARSRSG